MKILFTGGSSFTGYWFIQSLVEHGHEVTATFQQQRSQYQGVRRERVDGLPSAVTPIWETSFGDDQFVDLLISERWDAICHHGAYVTDYKSPHFDVLHAVATNTRALPLILRSDQAPRRWIVTGSVFEGNEGSGSRPLRAFSPYGLSKELSWRIYEHFATEAGVSLGKFVIPNPFGPLEDARFTTYLARCWLKRESAAVNTPLYVRDNIHVSLLARAYSAFVTALPDGPGTTRFNPCGYVETQGAFAQRVANELSGRLGVACSVDLRNQTEISEPLIRINTQPVIDPAWNESQAWDDLADYYTNLEFK